MKLHKILSEQRQFFNTDQSKDVGYRIEQLKKFKNVLKANETSLVEAINEDFCKSEFESYASELAILYQEINHLIRNVHRWSRKRRVPTGIANFPGRSYILPEPLGVTLVIGTWNFPYFTSLAPAAAAIAAGNTVILKPSEISVRTSKVMARIINENFSRNYFCVVEGGVKEATELLEFRYDKIFFTGSTAVGKIVYQAAAKHLTPVSLEMGGKNPTFVLADANIKMSAKRIIWGKFINAGQACISPDYILADQAIEEKLIDAFQRALENYPSTSPHKAENYVQIINTKNFDRLNRLMEEDKLCFGGQSSKEDRFIAPTILQNVTFNDEVMKDEIFGPILPVISFSNLDDVIQKVKEKPHPLACYIYSKNRKDIRKILKKISFGSGAINESNMQWSNLYLPFGGVGMSGIGKFRGKASFDTFTHEKSILDKPLWLESDVKYPPYSNKKLKLLRWILE